MEHRRPFSRVHFPTLQATQVLDDKIDETALHVASKPGGGCSQRANTHLDVFILSLLRSEKDIRRSSPPAVLPLKCH